jgi:GDP-4-dehydro-6-deoxy-D-mannose reductase
MSPYAVGKAAAELLCQASAQGSRFSIFIARPFTHIGPGQSARFSVARFASEIAEIVAGRRAAVLTVGDLKTTRDLTDVRDVVRAYDFILHRGKPGVVYNVCSGREVVMGDVLAELIHRSGIAIRTETDRARVRGNEQRRLRGSFERLREHTGWEPQLPLAKTLSDILMSTGLPVAN